MKLNKGRVGLSFFDPKQKKEKVNKANIIKEMLETTRNKNGSRSLTSKKILVDWKDWESLKKAGLELDEIVSWSDKEASNRLWELINKVERQNNF